MKKLLKNVSIIIVALLIIFNVWALVVNAFFAMPSEMKNEPVSFLAPTLTWNSTISDVESSFGDSEESDYENETNTKTYTYKTEYENHEVTVYAICKRFRLTEAFCRRNVYGYSFLFECADKNDEKDVFQNLSDELIKSKSNNDLFEYEKNGTELYATIWYGATGITYIIEYDETDEDNIVYLRAKAQC